MVDMARRSDEERMELFRNTASRKGLNEAIVEKDFGSSRILEGLRSNRGNGDELNQ